MNTWWFPGEWPPTEFSLFSKSPKSSKLSLIYFLVFDFLKIFILVDFISIS